MTIKTDWNALRRDVETHTRAEVVERGLILLAEQHPEVVTFCPHCKVQAGPCVTAAGQDTDTHKMRLDRAVVSV